MGGSFVPVRRERLSIAVPASQVSDTPHLREKTLKIGLIGRAAAIFRVNEIIIYPDLPELDQSDDANLIASILSYMEVPQYLRKRLIPFQRSLKYVGVLPPLRVPHHPTKALTTELVEGEFRDGVVVSSEKTKTLVDVGVDQLIPLDVSGLPVGKRVTVRIIEAGRNPRAALAKPEEVNIYWGYKVTVSNLPLGGLVKTRDFDLVIGTSRYGVSLLDVIEKLRLQWRSARTVLIAFGSPKHGLKEILARENFKLEDIAHFTVNTVPLQGTETVRTEEAIYISLGILNMLV
ncbi:RNA-binding protein [Candidatus Bathyarchaeota archaeon]|nr:RNA-binding protein [Candidatus Bathyarchaeota archaeon]